MDLETPAFNRDPAFIGDLGPDSQSIIR